MTSVAGLVTIGALNWWHLVFLYKSLTLAFFALSIGFYNTHASTDFTHAALHISASLGHHLLLAGLA